MPLQNRQRATPTVDRVRLNFESCKIHNLIAVVMPFPGNVSLFD